jgi:2-phosphosulfolactate phosphatase
MKIDAILSPAELPALAHRDLSESACVVFDVLRATSTFVAALHHGARAVVPVSEIAQAVVFQHNQPGALLAGERDGLKISAAQSGGIDFDFGNSPREFTPEKIRGKTIISTTTNGTRALRACAGAKMILASSFLNLSATARFLTKVQPEEVLLVCAGTGENIALEDVLAAGALTDLLADETSDAAAITRQTFLRAKIDLSAAIAGSKNGRRLTAIPELRADVAFCSQRDVFNLVALMDAGGSLEQIGA